MNCLVIVLILYLVGCNTYSDKKIEPLKIDKKILQLDIGVSNYYSNINKNHNIQTRSSGFNIGLTTLLLEKDKTEENYVLYRDVKYSYLFQSNTVIHDGESYQNLNTQKLRVLMGVCSKSIIKLRLCMAFFGLTGYWTRTNEKLQRNAKGFLIFDFSNIIGLSNIPLKIEFTGLKPFHTLWFEIDPVAGFTNTLAANHTDYEMKLGYSYSFY